MSVDDADLRVMTETTLTERRMKALFLYNAGATITKIAEENGVSVSTVAKDLRIARRMHTGMSLEDRTARQSAVVGDVLRANYPAMMRGDRDATRNIFDALKREARLFGLDAPTRVLAGISDIEFANEAAKLIERISTVDPHALKEIERARDADRPPIVVIDPDPGDDGGERPPRHTADPVGEDGDAAVAESEGAGADDPAVGEGDTDHSDRPAAPLADDEPWSNL